jgi:membrane associated rhomboid family serine protease
MPESKGRHLHHHQHPHNKTSNTHPKSKKPNRIVLVASLFFAFLGFGISYFIDDTSIGKAIAGALLGVIAGYIFGNQIKKSFLKK